MKCVRKATHETKEHTCVICETYLGTYERRVGEVETCGNWRCGVGLSKFKHLIEKERRAVKAKTSELLFRHVLEHVLKQSKK